MPNASPSAAVSPHAPETPRSPGPGGKPGRPGRLRNTRRWLIPLLALAAVLVAVLALRSFDATPPALPAEDLFATYRGAAMASIVEVTLPRGPGAKEAAAAVVDLFLEIEEQMSEWREGSPLTAVNRAAGGEAVAVPPGLLEILQRSVEISEATDGAFDPTWAALWGLWDFKAEVPRVPDPSEVARRAALVDFRRLEIDPGAGTVRLPQQGMMVGLGAIAKGFALDRAAELLEERGYTAFMLLSGGQVLARGARGDRPWRVGIRHPRGDPDHFFATLEARDASISTSGDYEAYFVVDGVRYHHVLDPRTGWPARGARSATVASSDATLGDALSTALLVLAPSRGLEVAQELGAQAAIVDQEGRLHTTPGIDLRLLEPPG